MENELSHESGAERVSGSRGWLGTAFRAGLRLVVVGASLGHALFLIDVQLAFDEPRGAPLDESFVPWMLAGIVATLYLIDLTGLLGGRVLWRWIPLVAVAFAVFAHVWWPSLKWQSYLWRHEAEFLEAREAKASEAGKWLADHRLGRSTFHGSTSKQMWILTYEHVEVPSYLPFDFETQARTIFFGDRWREYPLTDKWGVVVVER